MTFKKDMKPKPVTVEWWDSATHAGWVRLDSVDPDTFRKACDCRSFGHVIYQDGGVLVVAGTVGLDDNGYIDQVCDVMTIPMECVVKVRRR